MSYNVRRLSGRDVSILKQIQNQFDNNSYMIPTTYEKGNPAKNAWQNYSWKTGSINQKGARQGVFGYTRVIASNPSELTNITKSNPQMMRLFRMFMKSHNSSFKFKSVNVDIDLVKKRHKINRGRKTMNLVVSFGDFKGGDLVLEDGMKRIRKFNTAKESVIFNAFDTIQSTEPFKGRKYTLTFF